MDGWLERGREDGGVCCLRDPANVDYGCSLFWGRKANLSWGVCDTYHHHSVNPWEDVDISGKVINLEGRDDMCYHVWS